jgi:hypothetical protein
MAFVNRIEKFVIEATLLNLTDGESYNISTFITDVNIKKDYILTSFPLVVINMMTTETFRNIMRDNDISVKLKISKYIDINQEQNQDTEGIVLDDVVINTVIRSYKKPFTSTNSRTEDEEEFDNNSRDTTRAYAYQVLGIPEELVQKNRSVVNEIYQDVKIDEVLVNILSSVESRNIFIDASDNIDLQESLIIPPMNVIPTIKYIQDVYGIYNAGLSLFFDFDGTYLTKIFASSREYDNTLEILTVSGNDNTTDVSYTTPQFDENNNIRLNLQVPPPFVSLNEITMDTIGQTTVFNSYDYNFDVVKRIYNQETVNEKVRYFWNQFQNKIFEESYINESLRTSKAINVTMRNISPNYFKLNTLYNVRTNNDYVNGDYILTETTHIFYTRDYKAYESVINLKLTKK